MIAAKTADKTVSWFIQKELMKKQIFEEREKEKLIDEITNRVLSKISFSLDTSDAIKEVKELKHELENLTNFK